MTGAFGKSFDTVRRIVDLCLMAIGLGVVVFIILSFLS